MPCRKTKQRRAKRAAKYKAIQARNAVVAANQKAPLPDQVHIRSNAGQIARFAETYAPILTANKSRMVHTPREGSPVNTDLSLYRKTKYSDSLKGVGKRWTNPDIPKRPKVI